MALNKRIKLENGIQMTYHRIDDMKINHKDKELTVTIASYVDKKYRDIEVNNNYKKQKYEDLIKLIIQENSKTQEDIDADKIIKWSDEANSLVGDFKDEINLNAGKIEIKLENVEDFSLKNIYNLLKQQELFVDSKDI